MGQFFPKIMLEDMSEWKDKKFQGVESTLYDAMALQLPVFF